MARRGSVSFVELHLEKGLLGLAVAFLVFLAVRHLVMEPNKVDLGGEKLGPSQLDESVKRKADELKIAVASAKPKPLEVEPFAQRLREQFNAGILAPPEGDAPGVPSELKVVAQFGKPLPAFEGDLEASDIALVTPLPPVSLAVRTGISLALHEPNPFAEAEIPRVGEAEAAAELAWVSIAAYFPLEAQQREMTDAGYAGYRSKVHVVGVDVQRQEMTASGDFSDWKDVEPGKVMPKLELPKPVYDEKSGEVVNASEIDAKLEIVKRSQAQLMEPPFPGVEAGDDWDVPPLPGLEADEEEEETEAASTDELTPPKPSNKKTPEQAHPTPPPGGGGRGAAPPSGGGRGAPSGGGGRGAPSGGGGRGAPSGGNPFGGAAAQEREDPGKDAREHLKTARKALAEKKWSEAEAAAERVLRDPEVSKGLQAQAKKLLRDAERGQTRDSKSNTPRTPRAAMDLVKNPQKEGETAVWFHDDSVEPGKTYRYRMRVRLWNRYVGRRSALRDPSQADLTTVAGEWSSPGPAVRVAPKRHFFVKGPNFNEPTATVEVFAWHKGHWLKEDFKVRVGDTIGNAVEMKTGELDKDKKPKKEKIDFGTGAVVLDLRFDEPLQLRRAAGKEGEFAYRDTRSLVLVFLDPADGQVKQRITEIDKSDPEYKKLKEDWEQSKPL